MDFSFDSRVMMCRNCGAPLQTGFTGGEVACGYCGSVNVFSPRREEPVEPMAAAREIDEVQRMELLRRQDGKQPEIPAAINQLLSGGKLAPWKEGEALAMWRTTCAELSRGGSFSSAELLYFLTIVLSNHYSEKNEPLRQRALYESALEVLTLPRHRQIIRGMLSRNAALEGDLEAAEKWLEPCNPRSEDLESDSSYRVSKAEIFTVKGDWSGVLGMLGEDLEGIPVTSALDAKAIVQRANALERTGRVDAAAEQLSLFLQVNGSGGRHALRMIRSVYANAGIEICPVSIGNAMELSSSRTGSAQAEVANPGGCFGQIFAITGVLLIILALVLPSLVGSQAPASAKHAGIVPGVIGVIFLALGIRHVRAGRRTMRVHRDGIPARGVIRSIAPTGWRINRISQYALEVEVCIEGQQPYTTTVKRTIPDTEKEMFGAGAQVELKVDPDDRKNVTVLD